MNDGHANVTEDVMGVTAPQKLSNALPAVLCGVELLEVILAPISRHLKLWPCSIAIRLYLYILLQSPHKAPSIVLALEWVTLKLARSHSPPL